MICTQPFSDQIILETLEGTAMPATTSISELAKVLGTPRAPIIVDVRRDEAFKTAQHLLAGAIWRSPQRVQHWCDGLPRNRPLVVYCAHGQEVSQGVAEALDAAGASASYLTGGFGAWNAKNLPLRRKRAEEGEGPSQWVTRERPKIDRIACPWLIRRFIDPTATFIYVPADRVLAIAQETGATPYDVAGIEFTHEGDRCSFDTFIRIYGIVDPALDHLAAIVRGADTSRHDLTPQCGGLFAISLGLSANFANDHEMLEHGMVMYDALYTWCRSLQAETHNWPAATVKQASRG
jgi:rhodanese-related sulfurtransferase